MHTSPVWSAYIRKTRKQRQMTRRELAKRAQVDPSNITLWERDGHIPRREKLPMIARALHADLDIVLVAAGYAPESISATKLLDRVQNAQFDRLHPQLRAQLLLATGLTESQQIRLANIIAGFLSPNTPPRLESEATVDAV